MLFFEKHLANEYGLWRVHAKIIPEWLPPKEPSAITYIKPAATEKKLETAVAKTPEEPEKLTPQEAPAK